MMCLSQYAELALPSFPPTTLALGELLCVSARVRVHSQVRCDVLLCRVRVALEYKLAQCGHYRRGWLGISIILSKRWWQRI